MAETGRFFDAVGYTETQYAEVMNRMGPEGILRLVSSELAVSAPGGMFVRVAAGEAFIQGFWYQNTANVDLAIGSNSSGSTRTDYVVLRLDRVSNTISVLVRANAPPLTRTPGGTWEMMLASVSVANGAVSISAGNITDQRASVNCGYAGNGLGEGVQFNATNHTYVFDDGATITPNSSRRYTYPAINTDEGAYYQASDSGSWALVFGNNASEVSATKRGVIALAPAASRLLSNLAGDMLIYTSGGAAGRLLLGTAGTVRVTIDTAGAVSMGGTLSVTGSVSFSAGLNVNASGATAGQIRAGSAIFTGNQGTWGTLYNAFNVAASAKQPLALGIWFLFDNANASTCLLHSNGPVGYVSNISNQSATNFVFGTTGTVWDIYFDAGTSSVVIQNKTGASRVVIAIKVIGT